MPLNKPFLHFISGKDIALSIRKELREKIVKSGYTPGLAIILIGDDPASKLYVQLKKKAAHELGIDIHEYLFDKNCNPHEVKETIQWLNSDNSIDGIVIQLPLPRGFDEDEIIRTMDSKKDVDGFHPNNLDRLQKGEPYIVPALVQSIMRLIDETEEKISGKTALIIAHSEVFAKPLQKIFQERGVSATFIELNDKKFKEAVKKSDIIVVAVGKVDTLSDDQCKKGVIVIDVGINKTTEGTRGDTSLPDDLTQIKNIEWLSPVPGGVGPVTIAMLLKNVYLTALKRKKSSLQK